jgi:5-formyltetrahydrofolate cyclo-ligase
MRSKAELRQIISAQRNELNPQWLKSASASVVEHLQACDDFQAAKTIALYMAIAGEVNLDLLFPECWKQKKRTCIPVFNAEKRLYDLAEVDATTEFQAKHYGIREPINAKRIPPSEIDLMIVPGVAFDRSGNRLGRGGGYYDRLLDGYAGSIIAVTFDFQIFETIPAADHDIPVRAIVTETKIINVCNER